MAVGAGQPWFVPVVATALASGLGWGMVRGRRQHLALRTALPELAVVLLMMVVGAKIFSMIERGERAWWLAGAWSAREITQGYRHPGAMFGALAAGALSSLVRGRGSSVARLADVAAPPLCLVTAVMRINCLVARCCDGRVCQGAWCEALGQQRHPFALYLMAWALIVGVGLLWLEHRRRFPGQVALAYLVVHETGKAALETYRFPPIPFVQHGSLLLAGGAAIILALRRGPLHCGPRHSPGRGVRLCVGLRGKSPVRGLRAGGEDW